MLENQIDFQIRTDHGNKQIIADKKLINQVVVNLMNNAMDAVKEKEEDRIKFRVEIMQSTQNRVWICISNNGPLIPPDSG